MSRRWTSLLLLLLWTPLTHATDFYASPSGSGSSCTSGSPCSLTTVVTKPSCGDIVYLRGGTYNQNIDFTPYGCTSFSNAVTITSAPGEEAIIMGQGGGDRTVGGGGENQYTIYDRLTIDCSNTLSCLSFGGSYIRVQNSLYRNGEQNLTLPCDSSAGIGHNAIVSLAGAHHAEFYNSRFTNARCSYAFYMSYAHHITIDHCEMDHNGGYGFQVYTTDFLPEVGFHTITNNTIHDNGAVRGYGCFTLGAADGIVFANNGCWNNWAVAHVRGDNHNSQLLHNTFYGTSHGEGLLNEATGSIIRNNLLVNNRDGGLTNNGSGGDVRDNLTSAQLFQDASGGDFRLLPGSPAIDTVPCISSVTTDFEGTTRPTGSTCDAGYDEAGSGSGPTPLPAPTNFHLVGITP